MPANGISLGGNVLQPGVTVSSSLQLELDAVDGGDPNRHFKILAAAGSNGKCSGCATTMPGSLQLGNTKQAPAYQVAEGWGLFAGALPLGRGRRVRVHGSGTIFIIQCESGPPLLERVIIVKHANTSATVWLDSNGLQPPIVLLGDRHRYVKVINGVGGAPDVLSAIADVPQAGNVADVFSAALKKAQTSGLL